MKICILTAFYPPYILGGAEICAELFARITAENDIETYIVTPNYNSYENTVKKDKRLVIHRFKSARYFLFKKRKVSEDIYEKNMAFFYLFNNQYMKFSAWELAKEFKKIHKKEKFDLVLCNNIEATLALNKIKANIPKIAHVLDPANFCFSLKTSQKNEFCEKCSTKNLSGCLKTNKILAWLLINDVIKRRIASLKKADCLISMNQYIKANLLREGIKEEKIKVIHNPIGKEPVSELSKEQAKKKLNLDFENIILFLSSLTYKKGAHVVYELAEKMPDYNFVVVGFGPLADLFKNSKLPNLHFKGYVPFAEIKHYYKSADLFLFPNTQHEGMCRNIVEAQINGTPVIASNIMGISEGIEHGKTGILVKMGDVEEFKKAAASLMNNPSLRKKISENAKEFVEKEYNPEKIKKSFISAIRSFSKSNL